MSSPQTPLYCSTRGADRDTSFEDALLSAYASDGGLSAFASPISLGGYIVYLYHIISM